MHSFSLGRWLIVVLLWASPLVAQDPKPETVRRGKNATALVVLGTGRGFASAFCIDPSGYFVTTQHVVDKDGGSRKLQLVINPAEADERKFEAAVVRFDKTSDLALLRGEGDGKHAFTPLEFGTSDELIETQQLIAFGYPFGTALAVKEKEYPSISVNVGRITALRKVKGELERIQLDAQLNPGNSGGPVLDAAGKVVGIVRSGVLGAGVNFAIPVSHMKGFLTKPELSVPSPQVKFKRRHAPMEMTIRAVRFSESRPKLDVEVIVGRSKAAVPFDVARSDDADIFRVRVIPVPRGEHRALLPIAVTFSEGSMRCKTPDRDVMLDGKSYRLSKISRIQRNDQGVVIPI